MAGDIAISFLPPRLLISSCHRALDRRLRNGQRSKAIRIQKSYIIQYTQKKRIPLVNSASCQASICLPQQVRNLYIWVHMDSCGDLAAVQSSIKSFPLCRCVAASLVEVLFYPDESAATCCNNTLHFCLHRRQKNRQRLPKREWLSSIKSS